MVRTVGTYGFEGTKRWCVQLVHMQGFEGTNDYIICYFSFTKKGTVPFFPKTSLIDESRAMPLWPSCLNRVLILKVSWHIETG